jgi:3-hydroxybutyryl-CoA dehydrogenase
MACEIGRVAVVGSGVMGAGLAQLFAQNGHPVSLYDVSEPAFGKALERIRDNLDIQVELGWTGRDEAERTIDAISCFTDLEKALSGAEFVIEAAPEDLDLKRELFVRLGGLTPDDVILASNTSTFDVTSEVSDEIAPRVLIAHFFNPAQLIPLVEVVRGEATSDEAVDTTVELMRSLGKSPLVISRCTPGFVANRVQSAINTMAYILYFEGVVGPEEIDMAVETSFPLRLAVNGPFAQMDLGGLDTVASSARTMGIQPPTQITERVERGELGVKTGKGFYDYSGKSEKEILRKRDYRLMLLLEAYRKGLDYEP